MSIELHDVVHAVIAKAPQWIRQDLLSKDATMRERAEEALAAMVANAIDRDRSGSEQCGLNRSLD